MYRFAAAACVGAMLTGCSSEAGTTNAGPAEPEAALDGSYVVEWDGTGTKNGAPADDLNKSRNGWVFRTACDDSGCVAAGGSIADTANPSAPLKNVRVADYVDGRWSMVYFTEDALTCDGPNGAKYTSDGWTIWDIAISPDGTLAPTVTLVGTDDCEVVNVQSPTMTRTGDPLPGFPLPERAAIGPTCKTSRTTRCGPAACAQKRGVSQHQRAANLATRRLRISSGSTSS